MKASELTICPYTGLRSFTEEESLYFKGRDFQIDQITELLEKNKFLMVTGASGEGKSSLIFAGLIPNARAGFFKAKYTNWIVADFRPERSPVKNMALSIADKFGQKADTIETELRRGFTSLVDLYTNSEFYIEDTGKEWEQLPDAEKKNKKRQAANLMILVDQFEEFFTNPENFYNEAPSQDSQIVVNLILETAREAIKRNLPIYIVCTMRSDYIGQCSAFRGLPEYIGFSQFFVPRLKRKDLKQVIEEPAILSGNRISQRLIERIVYDIAEGIDQLPILQHALSQVWLAADQGRQEMDLIHYAMVGGMPADDLPDEDRSRFERWFNDLPEYQRKYYSETGLNKVIEIHASVLYEKAWSYYNKSNPGKNISAQEAKRIIALTFSCLTKIDNSRAVRNRMTLGEITSIINEPEFTYEVVGGVLNSYREAGNSFIRPFITDDPATHSLQPNTVLDITHESLIRNWNKLNTWANREFEFYSTYLDFNKQLDRWKSSGKSSNFLLPIGPLTYFENWYRACKPNAGWIRRYSEIQNDQDKAYQDAEQILADVHDFLARSARKVMVTRAFIKYGPQRIGTVLAILIMLVLSGFYWYDAEQKSNENVLRRVRDESFALMKSEEIDKRNKAIHLLVEERYQPGSLLPYLEELDFKSRLSLANEAYRILLYFDIRTKAEIKAELIGLIAQSLKVPDGSVPLDFLITEGNIFLITLARDQYYNPDDTLAALVEELLDGQIEWVKNFYSDKGLFTPTIATELNVAVQYWLASGNVKPDKVREIIRIVSPLEGEKANEVFNVYYAKGSFEPNGRQPSDNNGGYHTLASLYAAAGDVQGIEWCFNQLLLTNQRHYFEMARVFNNHLNILGFLYQYGHRQEVPRCIKWIETHTADNPAATLYRNVILRAGYISHLYVGANMERNFLRSYRGYLFPNLYFCDRSVLNTISEDYEKVLQDIKEPEEREYQLATHAKRKAIFTHKYWFDRQLQVDEKQLNTWLSSAITHYHKVPDSYLEGKVSSTIPYFLDGVRTTEISRKSLFIYPDYRDGWFSKTYHTDYFFNWLKKENLLNEFYKTGGDLQEIHFWIAKAFEVRPFVAPNTLEYEYPLPDEVLSDILSFANSHPEGKAFDKNLVYLILANRAFERQDVESGLAYYRSIDQQGISRSSDYYEYIEKTFFLNMMNQLCVHLASNGLKEEAMNLIEQFQTNEEKIFSYQFMAERSYQSNANPDAFVYLDSAFSKANKVDFTSIPGNLNSRYNLILLLSKIGSEKINSHAISILKETNEEDKFGAILARVIGVANEGNFYRSLTSIPGTLTESQDLECRSMIMIEACKKNEAVTGDVKWQAMDRFMDWAWYYIFYKDS
jgi:energy-coupling factor transporter ATP-binding protein EcfA2